MGPYNGFNPLNLRLHLVAASLSTFFFGGILIPCALSTLATATPIVVYLAGNFSGTTNTSGLSNPPEGEA